MPARSARRAPGATTGIELDVASVISSPDQVAADTARQLSAALSRSDVLLRTSRALVHGATGSLAITRTVCAALSRAARQAPAAEPAWVTAKGAITSHDVAHAPPGHPPRGGHRPAVLGVIPVFGPIDAAPQAIGMPCIVFAGDVGGDHALA